MLISYTTPAYQTSIVETFQYNFIFLNLHCRHSLLRHGNISSSLVECTFFIHSCMCTRASRGTIPCTFGVYLQIKSRTAGISPFHCSILTHGKTLIFLSCIEILISVFEIRNVLKCNLFWKYVWICQQICYLNEILFGILSKFVASLMRNNFPKRPSGAPLHTVSKF